MHAGPAASVQGAADRSRSRDVPAAARPTQLAVLAAISVGLAGCWMEVTTERTERSVAVSVPLEASMPSSQLPSQGIFLKLITTTLVPMTTTTTMGPRVSMALPTREPPPGAFRVYTPPPDPVRDGAEPDGPLRPDGMPKDANLLLFTVAPASEETTETTSVAGANAANMTAEENVSVITTIVTTTTTTGTTTRPPATTTTTPAAIKFPPGEFACTSPYTMEFPEFSSAIFKGLCVDDTTFKDCPEKITGIWPNTAQRVTSLRIFRPWHASWGDEIRRWHVWQDIKDWSVANNGQVLIGTEVSCDVAADDEQWLWALELMQLLGAEHVMGVAVGNEMDIFKDTKVGDMAACNDELWETRYWEIMQKRVVDMDLNGFTAVKITAIWSMSALGSTDTAFKEDGDAKVNTLVQRAHAKWGRRWVWSFNTYAVWDRSLWPTSEDDCAEKVADIIKMDHVKSLLRASRRRVRSITGNDHDTLWVGESGWPSPAPRSLRDELKFCPEMWSVDTLRRAYQNFLNWDLSVGGGLMGPEFAFYFAARDSSDPSLPESFGLMSSCKADTCKIQNSSSVVPPSQFVA